jgi:hypothetical protein
VSQSVNQSRPDPNPNLINLANCIIILVNAPHSSLGSPSCITNLRVKVGVRIKVKVRVEVRVRVKS